MSPPGLRPMRSRPLGLVPWTCRHRVASKSSKEQPSAACAALLVVTAWEMASAIRMPPVSARSTINQHKKIKGRVGGQKKSLKISFHFHFGGCGTSHHRDWLSRHKRLWLVTCHWCQKPGGPSASPPVKTLACTYVVRVPIRPSSGLNHLLCPQLTQPQEVLPRIHRCALTPRCELWSPSGGSV